MNEWFAKVRTFIKDTMGEMEKCNWPAKDQLFQSTVLVIAALAVTSLFVASVDQILFHTIQFVITF